MASRARGITAAFALIAAIVGLKLVSLQVTDPDPYLRLAGKQRNRVVELLAARGTIQDRNGVDLALSRQLKTITADPSTVQNPAAAAQAVQKLVPDTDLAALTERLSDRKSRFAYVARLIEPALSAKVLEALDQLGETSFFAASAQSRIVPAEGVGSAVIGKVDIDSNGTAGLEQLFDRQLRGVAGERFVERATDGSTIANSERVAKAAVPGDDVTVTIDRNLQYEAEQVLKAGVERADAASGVAVIGRPGTGEILAVANVLRDPDSGEVTTSAYNMGFAAAFEPGSVIKMVTAAAAYDTGETTPGEVLSVPDRLKVRDHTYTDHDPHPVTSWTVDDIIANSSNVGTITLGQRVGAERLDGYLRAFGLGSKTPVGFPHESAGLLRKGSTWQPTDLASVAIGQGVAVTPVQLWTAYNVIANRGVYVPPRIVASVQAHGEDPEVVPAGKTRRVLSEAAAGQVNTALEQVIESGTGSGIDIDGYSVAGKTGTAYKPSPNGGYKWSDGTHYTATFSGYLPANAPEVSITVFLDEPTKMTTGASAAGPVFAELSRIAVRRLGIAQDRPASAIGSSSSPVRATPAPKSDAATPGTTGEKSDGRAAAAAASASTTSGSAGQQADGSAADSTGATSGTSDKQRAGGAT